MPLSSRRTTAGDPPSVPEAHDLGATDESIDRMLRWFHEHGDIYRVFAPGRNAWTWVIHHPDDVKRVLVTNHRNYTKGVGIDRVRMLLGNGIMTSEGEFWRRQRRLMQHIIRAVEDRTQRIQIGNADRVKGIVAAQRLQMIEMFLLAGEQIVHDTDAMPVFD